MSQNEAAGPPISEFDPALVRAKDHLDKWWVDNKCPICQHDDWTLDHVAILPVRSGGAADLLGAERVIPRVSDHLYDVRLHVLH